MSVSIRLSKGSWYKKTTRGWELIDTELVYSDSYVARLNDHSLSSKSDYGNEIFLYNFLRYKELEEAVNEVDFGSLALREHCVEKCHFFKLKEKKNFKSGVMSLAFFKFQAVFVFLIFSFSFVCLSILFPFIMLLKACWNKGGFVKKVSNSKIFFLARSKSGLSRFKGFVSESSDSLVLIDPVSGLGKRNVDGLSIYASLNSFYFPIILLRSICYASRDFIFLFVDSRGMLGTYFALCIINKYWRRIPHKALYEACLETILRISSNNSEFYSAEKEDRFALMQTRKCRMHSKKLICLPHGLEYGFKFPGGLCGDVFYCFSEEAADHLNALYKTSKFVFTIDNLNTMLGITGAVYADSKRHTCFFTEPRDQDVNFEIIDHLLFLGFEFKLKLHPLEDKSMYKIKYPDVEVLDDLDIALRSNICISRKSTVLVESAARGNVTVSVLINSKDKFYATRLFPSLSLDKIIKIYNYTELDSFIASLQH